jgi:uracil-DNA glycosylase
MANRKDDEEFRRPKISGGSKEEKSELKEESKEESKEEILPKVIIITVAHCAVKQSTSLVEIAEKYAPESYEKHFINCLPELELLDTLLAEKGDYFPLKKDIFAALYMIKVKDIRVVFVGQDPYHSTVNINGKTVPQACGLAFGTRPGCKLQPSVANIYREVKREYPDFKQPSHGYFLGWVAQGVLALNSCLTVDPHDAGSHEKIWRGFMAKTLAFIYEQNPNVVYMMWGLPARGLEKCIGAKSARLYASHPSPMSCNRPARDAPAFMGCDHFKLANEQLRKWKREEIDWTWVE